MSDRLAARGPGAMRFRNLTPLRRRSAVLVPLYEHDGATWVVLTRRSPQLRSHQLEVAFPGGIEDDADADLWATARREAHEEIGLAPDLPRRIGELDSFVTVGSRSHVHPHVAALDARPHDLRPNPTEVDQILHVPLAELIREDVFREELWPIGDTVRPITFFELVGNTVWGATAAMLRQLLAVAAGVEDGLTS